MSNVPNYTEQGGARTVIGGELDIVSGGAFKIGGTSVTASAAQINAAAASPVLGNVAVAADALAIPVTHQHVSKTTGADAEALTLADGTPGQILTVSLVADGGGDGTLTPTTKSGFATIVFADAGDIVSLRFVDATVGWVILGSAGVAAPPVISV